MTDERASWWFALAMGATVAAITAFLLQLAVVPTVLVLVATGLLVRLDAPTGRLARRLIIRFETDVTEDTDRLERRPRALVGLFALFPIALAINAWQAAGPDDQWNTLSAAITAGGCWVGWSFAEHGRATGRPIRWFPYWLAISMAVGVFHTVGGPFHVRWAVCESRLTEAVQQGKPLSTSTTGWMCWPDSHPREVDGQQRLYLDGGIVNDNGEGLVYSPDGAIERAGRIKALRDLGGGWYWFETGSTERSIWFDG
ncbi:MAG: hypothetical protein Q7T27_06640 [Pseudomonas sp.]|uniref:hypothetical protein n=1 Tax=Pseudomonas sp. TaxID=306 RepID=UPI0027251F21|nr:hypothetical protein [Pseudomonas sp.]MDO8403157.1 hypothetical protein [Pseudomonas sp.]